MTKKSRGPWAIVSVWTDQDFPHGAGLVRIEGIRNTFAEAEARLREILGRSLRIALKDDGALAEMGLDTFDKAWVKVDDDEIGDYGYDPADEAVSVLRYRLAAARGRNDAR